MVSVLRSTEVRLASLELISIDQGKKRGMSNRHCTPAKVRNWLHMERWEPLGFSGDYLVTGSYSDPTIGQCEPKSCVWRCPAQTLTKPKILFGSPPP
jgi:hypothetical protein